MTTPPVYLQDVLLSRSISSFEDADVSVGPTIINYTAWDYH